MLAKGDVQDDDPSHPVDQECHHHIANKEPDKARQVLQERVLQFPRSLPADQEAYVFFIQHVGIFRPAIDRIEMGLD